MYETKAGENTFNRCTIEADACCKSDIICTNPAGKLALGRAFHHTFGFSGLVKKKDVGMV